LIDFLRVFVPFWERDGTLLVADDLGTGLRVHGLQAKGAKASNIQMVIVQPGVL
jgi:hypothetical protein